MKDVFFTPEGSPGPSFTVSLGLLDCLNFLLSLVFLSPHPPAMTVTSPYLECRLSSQLRSAYSREQGWELTEC